MKRTIVTPTLLARHEARTNVLWCATFQLAWDVLSRWLGGPVRLARSSRVAEALNGDPGLGYAANLVRVALTREDDVDPDAFVAAVAETDDDLDRIRREVLRIGGGPPELLPARLSQDLVLVYAYLFRELTFPAVFQEREQGIRFENVRVRAFDAGMEAKARSAVGIHHYANPREFLFELKLSHRQERLLVCRMEPRETLAESVAAALARDTVDGSVGLDQDDSWAMPFVTVDRTARFGEVEGAVLNTKRGRGPISIRTAMQSTRFRLDEKGVTLRSEAVMLALTGIHRPGRSLVCDGPFLLLLMRRGASRPYLTLWVDNEDVLEVSGTPTRA